MIRLKGQLEYRIDFQHPVEVVSILHGPAEGFDLPHTLFHGLRHPHGIINDDLVFAGGFVSQGVTDELVDHLEVFSVFRPAGENHRERQVGVIRVQKYAEQVKDFLCSTYAARKDNYAMAATYKGFQALFDIRHDHQLVHDRIGCFSTDDARFGDANVAAIFNSLLGVRDRSAFHRALHGARPTASANAQFAQAKLVAHFLAVLVFLMTYGMSTPAHNQVRLAAGLQHPRIAQNVKHHVGKVVRLITFQNPGKLRRGVGINYIPQNREQMLTNSTQHLVIHKCVRWRIDQLELQASGLWYQTYIEIRMGFHQVLAVIGHDTCVQNGQGALPKQPVQTAFASVFEQTDFVIGQYFQAALW